MYIKQVKFAVTYFMTINTIQSISCGNDSCFVVIKLCDYCKDPFRFLIFVILFLISAYIYKTKNVSKAKDFERNGFLFRRNKENNKFVFEN